MVLLKLYDCISVLTTDNSLHQWLINFAGHRIPSKKKDNWSKLSKHQMDLSFAIMNDGGWTTEKKVDSDALYSKNVQNIGKVLKFEGIINNSIEKVKEKIFDNVDRSPEWNTNLEEVRTIQRIDEKTSITCCISKRYHAIASREFVHLRSWAQINNTLVLTSVSINHPDVPESSNLVRGEHKLFAYFLNPVQNEPFKTHFVCLMNVNLRGWLPQTIVDKTISIGMLDHVKDIRYFAEK